ncbi:hypothetical protein R3P38DRAFT_3293673 [Favolaschia claudopus]|uniref:Uncharacterized protein n=1 Tax=Favolaschia claudopus TaxID=2862362 RepID=A0AAV9ZI28_9AGAR
MACQPSPPPPSFAFSMPSRVPFAFSIPVSLSASQWLMAIPLCIGFAAPFPLSHPTATLVILGKLAYTSESCASPVSFTNRESQDASETLLSQRYSIPVYIAHSSKADTSHICLAMLASNNYLGSQATKSACSRQSAISVGGLIGDPHQHYIHPNAWEWFHIRQTSESHHPLHESKVDLPAGWSSDWRNWIWGYELCNLEVDLQEEFGWGIKGRVEPLAYYADSVKFLFAVYSRRRGRYLYYFHAPGELVESLRRFRGKFKSHDDFLERFGTEWATGQWAELRMKRVKNSGHHHQSRRRIHLRKGIYRRGMDAHFYCPSWSKFTDLDIRFRPRQ